MSDPKPLAPEKVGTPDYSKKDRGGEPDGAGHLSMTLNKGGATDKEVSDLLDAAHMPATRKFSVHHTKGLPDTVEVTVPDAASNGKALDAAANELFNQTPEGKKLAVQRAAKDAVAKVDKSDIIKFGDAEIHAQPTPDGRAPAGKAKER